MPPLLQDAASLRPIYVSCSTPSTLQSQWQHSGEEWLNVLQPLKQLQLSTWGQALAWLFLQAQSSIQCSPSALTTNLPLSTLNLAPPALMVSSCMLEEWLNVLWLLKQLSTSLHSIESHAAAHLCYSLLPNPSPRVCPSPGSRMGTMAGGYPQFSNRLEHRPQTARSNSLTVLTHNVVEISALMEHCLVDIGGVL